MGFVQFPGTESEPAKSGPGVAQRLAQVYKEYLAGFDQVYITSVIDSRRKMQAAAAVQQAQAQAQAAAASGSGSGNGGPSQPQHRGPLNAQQMQTVIGYANLSVEELRAQGVQEKIISFVENNRAHLQRTVMEQGMFRGQFQNPSLRPPDQHGLPNAAGNFTGPAGQSNAGSMPNQQQQFLQQQQNGMQGNNFMDNRQQQVPKPQHPHLPNGSAQIIRPTQEQIQMAGAFIQKTKKEFAQNSKWPLEPTKVLSL